MSSPFPGLDHELTPQVRANCLLADAKVAGYFSMCGLLLRMRNLFKWEHQLPPWQEEAPQVMLEWVDQREEAWEGCRDQEPQPITLGGRQFDPFDVDGLEELLAPAGLVYGAGRAGGLLPAFFLGRLARSWSLDGLTVIELGEELTQDLFFLPGLRQGRRVFLRPAPLGYLIWDLLTDPRPGRARLVKLGLKGYGLERSQVIQEANWQGLEPIIAGELKGVLWHELGETRGGELASGLLHWALAQHPGSDVEFFVRAVKDLLADTCPGGRLDSIIQERAAGTLGFYPAWLGGYIRMLFPEIDAAVLLFDQSEDWAEVDQVRLLGWQRAQEAVGLLEEIRAELEGGPARDAVRGRVIGPLTGFRSPVRE